MNRATRVLVFPTAVAIATAVQGCEGVKLTDPSVRACYPPDTTVLAPGVVMIRQHDTTNCQQKKAA